MPSSLKAWPGGPVAKGSSAPESRTRRRLEEKGGTETGIRSPPHPVARLTTAASATTEPALDYSM